MLLVQVYLLTKGTLLHKINIYSIAKSNNDEFDLISNDFIKMSSKYAKVESFNMFNKKISKAQMIGQRESQQAYTDAFLPHMQGFNIALDVKGKKLDSFKFAKLIDDKVTINFFIGGAYGFNNEFLQLCDAKISLSELTMAHKIAHVVLMEQIFRGLCINNNHPYHK
ncbi:23S rRNA (pseudouridine(1915)-N(3))-methyltransferase RlmH [Arcobacter sp. 31_11_sub10_T18]|mgnify:FL=1|nr:23S rRNA (pseudouridine(1915)-N(3))-methyltransferase RlmH [Arcobacter sp. 31_11_sub10_T18]